MPKGQLFIVAVLLAVLIGIFIVVGNNTAVRLNTLIEANNQENFKIMSKSILDENLSIVTFYDTENHVVYLYMNGGLCPLYDSNGNIFIYQGD